MSAANTSDNTETLTQEEQKALIEILKIFQRQIVRDTGMKWVNGGYASAEMNDYDEDTINIELEWGEQDMGAGRSVSNKESYTLSRNLLLLDIDVMKKIAQINLDLSTECDMIHA